MQVILRKLFRKRDESLVEIQKFTDFNEAKKEKLKSKSTIKRLFKLLKIIFDYHDRLFSTNFKEDLKRAVRNDLKLLVILSGLIAFTFIVLTVFWLFIAIAITTYFYEAGNSMLSSILFTIGIHMIALISLCLGILNFIKKFKSQKVYTDIRKDVNLKK